MMTGQDIGRFSASGLSAGLVDRFGPQRIRDCPISESAMIGMAVGAAMKGWTSVVELAYADISAVAFGSIVHSACKLRFSTAGQLDCPVIIHAPIGRGSRHGPMGTEITASWYCNVPDLAICMPATPDEAYWQLREAFNRKTPTLYLPDRSLFDASGDIGDGSGAGRAKVVHPGTDLSIVAAGRALALARDAAVQLQAEGVSAEVLSLGHVKPFDHEALERSARRTRRMLVVQDEPGYGGYGAIALASLAQLPAGTLERAARLLCREETFLPHLGEEGPLPTVAQIAEEARSLVAGPA
ncbi:transketolase C-terminal domain-containing protein [Pigmentiphaga humi]|nr:transketolase C-terminal domain-containing protein [Pigmentiphaga humi]